MPRLVDLRKKPYYLNDDQIAWVESTLENLTDEEKIGQLFVNLFFFGGDAFSGNNLRIRS
ncbi:beta-N-acetylglucosaminidase/beta-glucosidase (3-beta-N-acetyl-D-glucosaminidase/beta-D-glucosidase)(Nag3) [Streptococcus pneumoniae]|uniref:Beta-N-acetylglucosaminidase/beta-glucosidase (3-beta-N-acetyl-D-glucosaminidase/beta-D-glucosidase)(Nag3) n=1 Tax=Streptococcus pneumoniae TaxID=1313 RepID=A0AAQ2VXT7_STREE|nr:beta-N-acetylglucosaminidase/beta-glucosidase (3-beta-N-acetyl-D-glucosaminidase/beta-D-glucosidase)(Nag3) [Streptococcus pneumoniae]VST61810.1 beta-N-acetylglucosaminidase/beta-glucosidase (3-beta-N-acetyl-D-glucosaminidase/beta-D-glucosidase)(Nag3) [Streptococcus pneumoniae]VTE09488.1 beta-N-acetylglucosaminidase/beta-glucosidase (3-beta-N-acetyl-D-glucosaminidase/beta-D-glucosidase)(Nag3) [Streptococcus pneumoniae]